MPRKIREQEFDVKLNIHLKHDLILLRDIIRFIHLAIKLGGEEERKEDLRKNQQARFIQHEQNVHGL
jgi:hypothetical protein